MIALIAPGQGSQVPGMLAPWLALDGAAEQVAFWSAQTGLDLHRLGTTADAEEIKDTAVAQPLITALTLLAFQELERRIGVPSDLPIAGHSVGELAAAAMAQVISADNAVELAAVRGRAMAAACQAEETGMVAVMGGDTDELLSRLDDFDLTAANRNGAGQTVVAGSLTGLDKLLGNPVPGSRVVPLKVAGAFHTTYMSSAKESLADYAQRIQVADPVRPLVSNSDGQVLRTGAEVLNRLISQVTNPVRWDLCMDRLTELGVDTTVELPPAGVLTGLVKRHLKGRINDAVAIKAPADLDLIVGLLSSPRMENLA